MTGSRRTKKTSPNSCRKTNFHNLSIFAFPLPSRPAKPTNLLRRRHPHVCRPARIFSLSSLRNKTSKPGGRKKSANLPNHFPRYTCSRRPTCQRNFNVIKITHTHTHTCEMWREGFVKNENACFSSVFCRFLFFNFFTLPRDTWSEWGNLCHKNTSPIRTFLAAPNRQGKVIEGRRRGKRDLIIFFGSACVHDTTTCMHTCTYPWGKIPSHVRVPTSRVCVCCVLRSCLDFLGVIFLGGEKLGLLKRKN